MPAPLVLEAHREVLECAAGRIDTHPLVPYHETMRRVARERGLLVVDPVPELLSAQRRGVELFIDECHLTPAGHERMAEALARVLRQE